MERRGRDEVDVIARETSNETGKTEEEVRRYHKVFWERHKELADWERVIDKIEKGEKRLQRSKEIREALAEKIARSPKPHECLPLNYGASRGKVWTEEEDAFLLNMMHTYGYGNWERIRVEIREALAEKIARSPKPHECLPLNYGASRGKVWTEEEDASRAVWKSNCRHLTPSTRRCPQNCLCSLVDFHTGFC